VRFINTVRGAAFVALAVLPAAVAFAAAPPAPTTSNGTIYWSSQSFYQVQRTTAQNGLPVDYNLCDSNRHGQSCAVPAGKYVVNAQGGNPWARIAEWPLTVTAATAPASSSAPVKPTVANGRITWTSGYFYQVQRTTVQNGLPINYDLCNSNGGLSCAVPAGTYVVNAQGGTPYRKLVEWTLVVPGTSSGPTGPTAPTGGSNGSGPQHAGSASGTAIPGSGAGSLTAPIAAQPGAAGPITSCSNVSKAWEFLQGSSGPLSPKFYGGCQPGDGLVTNAWMQQTWRGNATVNTGTPGSNFWIDWKNTGVGGGDGHAEFDIGVARAYMKNGTQGYGQVPIRTLLQNNRDLRLTAKASWAPSRYPNNPSPVGKVHAQAIIWLADAAGKEANAGQRLDGSCAALDTIDITVVQYINEAIRQKYRAGRELGPTTQVVGLNQSIDGERYDIFVRDPGDVCERASYLAIRTENAIGTTPKVVTVNARAFIDRLMLDGYFDRDWYISRMGWEVAGASGDTTTNTGNSGGKIVFDCYSIPMLSGTNPDRPGFRACR